MLDPQEQALPKADAKPWYRKLGPGVMAVRPNIMGQFTINRRLQILGWLATITMGGAVVAMFLNWQ